MAFLPGLVKLVKAVARPVGKIIEGLPVVGAPFKAAQNISAPIVSGVQKALKLAKKVPLPAAAGVGGAAAGAGLATIGGGSPEGVPALPNEVVPFRGSLPVPYTGALPMSMARGAGKAMLLNPNMQAAIMSMSIDPSQIPVKYNPPHGYVIIRIGQSVLCIPRSIAVHFGLWHAGRKPPISAGDWHKYQTAQRVEKKLRHLAIHALRHNRATSGAHRLKRK